MKCFFDSSLFAYHRACRLGLCTMHVVTVPRDMLRAGSTSEIDCLQAEIPLLEPKMRPALLWCHAVRRYLACGLPVDCRALML